MTGFSLNLKGRMQIEKLIPNVLPSKNINPHQQVTVGNHVTNQISISLGN